MPSIDKRISIIRENIWFYLFLAGLILVRTLIIDPARSPSRLAY